MDLDPKLDCCRVNTSYILQLVEICGAIEIQTSSLCLGGLWEAQSTGRWRLRSVHNTHANGFGR